MRLAISLRLKSESCRLSTSSSVCSTDRLLCTILHAKILSIVPNLEFEAPLILRFIIDLQVLLSNKKKFMRSFDSLSFLVHSFEYQLVVEVANQYRLL